MPNTFVCADPHLGHKGVCVFTTADGSKVRPWDSAEEMDEAIIDNWNKTVRPNDKVYVLGDVVINRKALPTVGRLNGDKVLIKGNHDIFRINEYLTYFRDIRAYQVWTKDKIIMSHIQVHPDQLEKRWRYNVHGHTHTNHVKLPDGTRDTRYICVSMEQINFTPISYDELKKLYVTPEICEVNPG